MAKLLVLGANGFIGKNLTKKLAENKQNDIVAFGRFSDYKTQEISAFSELDNVTVFVGDFSNRADVAAAVKNVDYVFHFISTTNPATSDREPLIDIETNMKYTVELLELCVQNGVKKVIFPSSGGTVYGDVDSSSIDELTIPKPRSPYGISKLAIENYLRYFRFNHGLDYAVYRIANPYGPGQNIQGKQGVIPIFMNLILSDRPITIYGDGSMVRDYFFIDDLVNMIASTYSLDNQHDEYNLGSGDGTSVTELIDIFEKHSGNTITRNYVDQPSSFIHKSVLNIDRFTTEFNIAPTTSLEDGIKRTWDYVKKIK